MFKQYVDNGVTNYACKYLFIIHIGMLALLRSISLHYNAYTFSIKPSLIHVFLKCLAYKITAYLSLGLAKYRGSIWYICECEESKETSLNPDFCINQFDTIASFPFMSNGKEFVPFPQCIVPF